MRFPPRSCQPCQTIYCLHTSAKVQDVILMTSLSHSKLTFRNQKMSHKEAPKKSKNTNIREMCTNALFWPSLTPPPNPVKFFWSKMACTCVPHIVLHVSCRTRTSGGYFRPSEVRFRAKIPLSSHWFYNVKTQKTHFLKIPEWADFDLLESNCRHIFLHKNQKIYHR